MTVKWIGPERNSSEALVQHIAKHLAPAGRLLWAKPLGGGISARTTAFELGAADGSTQKLVLRQPGPRMLARRPNAAWEEFDLLQRLLPHDLGSPVPVWLDSGTLGGQPGLVLNYLAGQPWMGPEISEHKLMAMAMRLARIHAVEDSALASLPRRQLPKPPAHLDQSLQEGRIREALMPVWPLPESQNGLLHGDFWPGNLLWEADELKAVIDWEDAGWGDPLADLASARLDVLWIYGQEAMECFTKSYLDLSDCDPSNLPYWDLWAALRPAGALADWALGWSALGRPELTEARLREDHGRFVAQAFAAIGI
ncbi:MAG: phosphotransferase family protein [Candidatus Melainabacteria bacterium HGW-Melainabacteria-1]|nr:MAG: phosphotransferase family protein [Candidatus Melainabacteria bacterium HGW-Melainabacteria-1]